MNTITEKGISLKEACEIISELLENKDIILAGYNSDQFDIPFLQSYLSKNGYVVNLMERKKIDVLKLVRQYIEEELLPFKFKDGVVTDKHSHKLEDVYSTLIANHNLAFHNAEDDVEATKIIFDVICDKLRKNGLSL